MGDDDDSKKKKKKKDADDAENGDDKKKKKSKKPAPLVGEVLEMKPIPKKDKLRIATVKVGQAEVDIVTNAPNVHLSCAGKKFIVALPGVTTANGIEVKVAKVGGVESSGMFCGPNEMGWSTDILEADLAVMLDDAIESGSAVPSYEDAVAMLKEREKAAAAEAKGKKGKKGKAAKEDDDDFDALMAEFKDPNADEKADDTGKKGKKKDKAKQKAAETEDFEAALAEAAPQEKAKKEETKEPAPAPAAPA